MVFTNGRAKVFLTGNGRLRVVDGRLVVGGKQQAKLDALLKDSGTEEMLGISHPSSGHNLWLIRLPMPQEGNAPPDARRPAVALMIHDPAAIDEIDLRGFAKVHRLTPAEGRIINLLLEHTSLPPIAKVLGVSPHTIRSQFRAILDKTGAKRQAELVRMLMSWQRRIG